MTRMKCGFVSASAHEWRRRYPNEADLSWDLSLVHDLVQTELQGCLHTGCSQLLRSGLGLVIAVAPGTFEFE